MPFKLVKNLKLDSISNIILERNKGNFKDIYDFFKRTVNFLNKNDYISLINASALKEFKYNTKTLLSNLDSLIKFGNLASMLGNELLLPIIEIKEELPIDKLRVLELNSYGFYLTNHPASKYSDCIKVNKVNNYLFKKVVMNVLVEKINVIKTKKNEDMAFILGSDETGNISFTIFPKVFYMLQNIKKDDMIKVWGNVSKRYDKISIVVDKLVKEE